MSDTPLLRCHPIPGRLSVRVGGGVSVLVGLGLGGFGGFLLTILYHQVTGFVTREISHYLDVVVLVLLGGFVLFALALAAVGLWMVHVGFGLILGRQEVCWTSARLECVLRVGRWRWWSSGRRRDRITQLTLRPAAASWPQGQPEWTLEAEGEGQRPLMLLSLALKPLQALATKLAEDLGLPLVTEGSLSDPPGERPQRPLNVSAVVERSAESLRVIVPPAQLWGSQRGCWVVLVGLALVMLTLFIAQAFLDAAGLGPPPEDPYVPVRRTTEMQWVLLLSLWLGAGLGLVSLLFWRRQATVLTVTPGRLSLVAPGMSGPSEWSRDQLADVRVTQEHFDDDNESGWLIQLAIAPVTGEPVRVLGRIARDYRGRAELEWVATVLRQGLRLNGNNNPRCP